MQDLDPFLLDFFFFLRNSKHLCVLDLKLCQFHIFRRFLHIRIVMKKRKIISTGSSLQDDLEYVHSDNLISKKLNYKKLYITFPELTED